MKIQGRKNVRVTLNAKYKQPYPVARKNEYKIGNSKADLVFVTDEINLLVDGESYLGIHVYLLFKQ
jgi:hypothetical protein